MPSSDEAPSQTWELVSERPGGTVSSLVVGDAGVLALTTAALHRSTDGGANWSTLTAGRLPPPLNGLAQSGDSLFVGAQNGVWRSRDLGRSWTAVLSGGPVLCLGVTPDAGGRTLLAGSESDGLLRSEDDGGTWASANPGLFDQTVSCVAATSTGISFVGTPTGVYRSGNGGRSWREVPLPCGPVSVECLAVSDKTVLVGTDSAGAFRSVEGGRSWAPLVGVQEAAATAATVGSDDDGLLAVGSPSGVYVSRDAGQTWDFEAIGCVLALAGARDFVLAGLAGDGVSRLDTISGTWRPSSAGLNGRLAVDLGYTGRADALVTADLEGGIQRSIDHGRTWQMAGDAPDSASRLAIAAGVMYAASPRGLYASSDTGLTWTILRGGAGVRALAVTPSGVAVAAFEDDQIAVFDETCQPSWLQWDATRGRIVAAAMLDPDDLVVGAVGERSVVWRSADRGRTWATWFQGDAAESMCLAASVDDRVLVGLHTRVFRSPSWSAASLAGSVTSIAFGATPNIVYASTAQGVQRSVDRAQHFSVWSQGLPAELTVLAVQHTPRAIYALGYGGTLWRRSAAV